VQALSVTDDLLHDRVELDTMVHRDRPRQFAASRLLIGFREEHPNGKVSRRFRMASTLTFNRPDRLNALSTPIMEGLLEALPRLARDGVIVPAWVGRE
jgi:hypothetical protein